MKRNGLILPDLSPIENLWALIDEELVDRNPSNEDELLQLLQEGWSKVCSENGRLEALAKSMVKRIKCCIKVKGNKINY